MNYGKNSVAKKLRQTNSKAEKITSKLLLLFVKAVLVCFAFCAVVGVSLGYGVFKGVIDSAPEIDVASIEPSGCAPVVYDGRGHLTGARVGAGASGALRADAALSARGMGDPRRVSVPLAGMAAVLGGSRAAGLVTRGRARRRGGAR